MAAKFNTHIPQSRYITIEFGSHSESDLQVVKQLPMYSLCWNLSKGIAHQATRSLGAVSE